MNYIFTIVFLIIYMHFIYYTGNFMIKLFGFQRRSTSEAIIFGYISITAMQWSIGVIAQFFHLSWNLYFYTLLLVYGLWLWLLYSKGCIIKYSRQNILIHIKKYWFLYITALFFLYWSVSSQMPYLEMNYDDHYYIGAMMQQSGSEALSTKNFFTGAFDEVPFVRLINTYEINYAFWANLFHISIPFFCRFTMTLFNYILVFMSFHAFFSVITKKNNVYLQFVILPFTILLIPGYFLQVAGLIKMYDDWQFNTAIWYGGSVVRVTSLPVCLLLVNEWVQRPTCKKTSFILIASICYVSLSSVFLTFAISIGLISIVMLVYKRMQEYRNVKWIFATIFTIVLICFIIKLGPILLEKIAPVFTEDLQENLKQYVYFRRFYGYYSKVFIIYVLTLVLLFYKQRSLPFRRMLFSVLLLCVIVYSGIFDKFFILVSQNVVFVGMRLMTGLQLMLISYVGYLICLLFEKFNLKIVSGGISFISLLLFTCFNFNMSDYYVKLAYPGTGLSSYGYSYDRIFVNDQLVPQIYIDIGKYLKENETSTPHKFVSPYTINYEDGVLHLTAGMVMSSNNIISCMTDRYIGTGGMNWGIANNINSFLKGEIPYENVELQLRNLKIEYLLTDQIQVVNDLKNRGMELKLTSISIKGDKVYLLKTDYFS